MFYKTIKILELQINSRPLIIEVNLFFFVVYTLFIFVMFLITYLANENVELLVLYQNQKQIDGKLDTILQIVSKK